VLADDGGVVTAFSAPARGNVNERHFLSVQVVSPELLDTLPASPECFGTFTAWYPEARARGHVFRVHETAAEWHAVDSPELYLAATRNYMAAHARGPFIAASAHVAMGAVVDAASALHARCVVGMGARIIGSVLLPGASVGDGAVLEGCLVGADAVVAPHARLRGAVIAA